MGGKTGFRSYPRHLGKSRGRGVVECDASGFLRHPDKIMQDVRQGYVAKKFADITPGFGTRHPQDVVQLGVLDDPRPIPNSNPADTVNATKLELGISDNEIEDSIREGRAPVADLMLDEDGNIILDELGRYLRIEG